jgi:hypothetical protein
VNLFKGRTDVFERTKGKSVKTEINQGVKRFLERMVHVGENVNSEN